MGRTWGSPRGKDSSRQPSEGSPVDVRRQVRDERPQAGRGQVATGARPASLCRRLPAWVTGEPSCFLSAGIRRSVHYAGAFDTPVQREG